MNIFLPTPNQDVVFSDSSRPLIATSVCKCGWWIQAESRHTEEFPPGSWDQTWDRHSGEMCRLRWMLYEWRIYCGINIIFLLSMQFKLIRKNSCWNAEPTYNLPYDFCVSNQISYLLTANSVEAFSVIVKLQTSWRFVCSSISAEQPSHSFVRAKQQRQQRDINQSK